jgi:acetyltransferase-like isoleucine patch superfamily enzyme
MDNIEKGKDVVIEPGAVISVRAGRIGDRTIIRSGARIEGYYVELGEESYLDHGAWIGGGSCFDSSAYLKAGPWLHMGWNSQINIARGVDIGEEVGIGIETKIFTHGAFLPVDLGFPAQWESVKIGNRVWLPNAWVNPGVTIGSNVVVAAKSLVNRDLPSGCLAGGIPAKVLKEGAYPIPTNFELPNSVYATIIKRFIGGAIEHDNLAGTITLTSLLNGDTVFDVRSRVIKGISTPASEYVKDQLRRNGIRFKYTAINGVYVPWEKAYVE